VFILIELLVVIVILAIIALIAIPIILNIIEDTKQTSYKRSKEMYLHTVEIVTAVAVLAVASRSKLMELE